MCINTVFLVMVLAPRTPCSLEVKDVKIRILRLYLMQQVNRDLILGVCKCAHLAILAVFHLVWVCLAKLGFVLLGMIKLLHSVMCLQAWFPLRNALIVSRARCYFWAHLACVAAKGPSAVFFVIVIVKTPFGVVLRLGVMLHQEWTGLGFEFGEV